MMTTIEFEKFVMWDFLYDRLIEDKAIASKSREEVDKIYDLGTDVKVGVEGYENISLDKLYYMSYEDVENVYKVISAEYEKNKKRN